ncbi:GIY-YIG nuclease family protein [Paenibacillus rhizovicinus]|uniref:GIY-YIG nuclease family protein n=2 Tax=Paenibacillus rhizovicinus TaxID=2704463 RepID=A0A6C0PAF4_9BACL|nr:GIY-YIG nuclease family protein [Paenibacillus rhizovicinus]
MTLDKQKKKEIASAYKTSFRPMGVYQIRNTVNGKLYVDGTMDLEGARNRFDFFKQTNMNTMSELRQDWAAFGGDAFVFEELDQIKPREETLNDPSELASYKEEVQALLELWLEKLQPYDEQGYNKRKRKL